MAKSTRPLSHKRDRERARREKQKDKETRRLEAKERRATATPRQDGEDPDIAGIVPGPQPLPPQFHGTPPEDE
ncbi:MAG: hypothetical protein AB1634_02275 [Thermodesulfobacteriota bacterium]